MNHRKTSAGNGFGCFPRFDDSHPALEAGVKEL